MTMHKCISIVCIILSTLFRFAQGITKGNPNRFGPITCGEMIQNYKETHLTEFPTDPNFDVKNGLNFLQFGDTCSTNAEVNFKARLHQVFDDWLRGIGEFKDLPSMQRTLAIVWANVSKIWNDWRLHVEDGESGDRICNPRRLLACHQTLKKCQCLQDFSVEPVGGEPKKEDYSVIVSRPTFETVITHDQTVNRTVCKALKGSFCDYEVPWLFFCQIECLGNEICVGQISSTPGRKICRECTVQNPEACETDEKKYKILYPDKATNLNPLKWHIITNLVLISVFKLLQSYFT